MVRVVFHHGNAAIMRRFDVLRMDENGKKAHTLFFCPWEPDLQLAKLSSWASQRPRALSPQYFPRYSPHIVKKCPNEYAPSKERACSMQRLQARCQPCKCQCECGLHTEVHNKVCKGLERPQGANTAL
eukprot:365643-Chlamydomonas_euryale.AAC.10